ncbi:DnaJ-domain-containing protein [Wallemia mellicola]|uniref:DnaJ-domain-containing protein n=1 Tax=Wallemia mellicola TaxID=1708541 RepID=A0AB38MSD7_9BASI|nr:DnaJ-domain-containing protein [Wallemia mellicola]TIC61466.1 DnaJ-domain-containing protein [Wallemia mellicola]
MSDDARKSLNLALSYYDKGNLQSALKFAKKSIRIERIQQAIDLIDDIEKKLANGETGTSTASSAQPNKDNLRNRQEKSQPKEEPSKGWTPAQQTLVKRVRSCKPTAYYEILALEKTCSDNDIKKAYRKLALQLHPDKNSAPGADEAFKLVSKAFQVLSDEDKRASYDKFGSDPDARFGSGGGGGDPFAGMRTRSAAGPQFESEVSPEDLFNMFFGGGMGGMGGGPFGGNAFGGGPFASSFGGPGFSMRFGGPGMNSFPNTRRYPRQQQAQPQSMMQQLLPILILIGFTMISYLPSLLGSLFSVPPPAFSLDKTVFYSLEKTTGSPHNVKYFVNPSQWRDHPYSQNKEVPQTFSKEVEKLLAQRLGRKCKYWLQDRDRRIERYSGFFGIGKDDEKLEKVYKETNENCNRLRELGYSVNLY